ncbi:hypothetical protein PMAYCL1PPCAC_04934, partial [Pristionchus mayeri]
MAGTHSAVSFPPTRDIVSDSSDQELLRDVWQSYMRGIKRRLGRFSTNFRAGTFPANPLTLAVVVGLISIFSAIGIDVSFGVV